MMIENIIIKSEIYKNKVNDLKEKEREIKELKCGIEKYKRDLNDKNQEIELIKNKLLDSKSNLDRIREFEPIIELMDEIKDFNSTFISYSKLTRNDFIFHDKDKICVNKKYLQDNFFNIYDYLDFKEKLNLLRLLNIIEMSEEKRFTKKIFVNGKYKRMIVFNREAIKYYCNLCSVQK